MLKVNKIFDVYTNIKKQNLYGGYHDLILEEVIFKGKINNELGICFEFFIPQKKAKVLIKLESINAIIEIAK